MPDIRILTEGDSSVLVEFGKEFPRGPRRSLLRENPMRGVEQSVTQPAARCSTVRRVISNMCSPPSSDGQPVRRFFFFL